MSEIIKPKKERKFLKALGKIGEVLIQELFFKVGSNLIRKIGGKKTLPSILFIFISLSLFAQFPNTGNKQRLGFQTTGDGLVWRGSISDTASIQPINNQNAWVIIDTVNLKLYSFDFTSNVWNLISGAGVGLTMPFDSITFNTAKDGTVGVGEVEYNDTQGSLIQGLKSGNVTNVIGQQLHQRVNNRTGATLNKGDVVYLAGSQGNRITVAKGLAVSDAFSANTFGVVAESIADNQSGFIITEGLITGLNTSALTEDSAVYLSPTVAGALTSTKPQAPQHSVYIGVCVKSNNGSGELFVKIRNGQELDELHDVRISSPVTGATLFYSGGLWRDTTAALLVSDTASMLSNYATKAYADTTGRFYARQEFRNVSSSTLTWTQSDTLVVNDTTSLQVYRNGQILMPNQYTVPTSTSVVIASTSYKAGENYTVIFPRGGGAGSGGGSGSLTSISGGTGIIVSPDPITTTGTVSADLSVLMELTDTSLLNLTSRFNTKLNISDTASMLSNYNTRINSKLNISDTASMLTPYFRDADTTSLNLTSRFALKLNATDTASLSNRIDAKGTGTVTNIATGYGLTGGTITSTGTLVLDSAVVFSRIRDSIVDVAIGNDTIKILKQEYAPATTSVLTWTITPKFPIQSKSFILVFRNGQLLINDQYNLTDTNKITIVSNSFKVGSNYTVVTVSGIGSVGTGVFPNPIYPDAGIAVSTGTTWTTSIPNNSTNWNIAFNDKINNAAFSGTTTKTLTLTQYDGGTLTAPFTDLQGIVAADTADMLKNYLRTGVAASTYLTQSSAASTYLPLTGGTLTGGLTGTTGTFNTRLGVGSINNPSVTSLFTSGSGDQEIHFTHSDNTEGRKVSLRLTNNHSSLYTFGGLIYALQGEGFDQYNRMSFGISNTEIMHLTRFSRVGIMNNSPSYTLDVNGTFRATSASLIGGTLGVTGATTLASTLAVSGNITEAGNNVLTSADTASMLLPYTKTANAITGSGTSTYIPLYSSSNTLSNSIIRQTNSDAIFINGSATFNNMVQAQEFRSPITISLLCGSSGSPNTIDASTGNYVNNCSTGTAYLLLPNPSTNFNRLFTVTNLRSDQSIVLNTSGSYSNARPLGVDGGAESSIPVKRWITVQSNGLNWYIIATGSAL